MMRKRTYCFQICQYNFADFAESLEPKALCLKPVFLYAACRYGFSAVIEASDGLVWFKSVTMGFRFARTVGNSPDNILSFNFLTSENEASGLSSDVIGTIDGQTINLVLPDGTRCDCLTDTHAIEFDFGDNWSEAIGQSAYYSIQTGKKAGIVLILETIKDRKYWIRLNTTIEHFNLPIDTWSIENIAY